MNWRGVVKYLFMVLVLMIFPGQNLYADQPVMQAAEVVVTTGIQDRIPVDAIQSYAASVESLYCYCRMIGVRSEATIEHVWYHNGREVSRISLPVRSSNWRTWSKKTIPAGGRGAWRVDVLDDQGEILGSQGFTLM